MTNYNERLYEIIDKHRHDVDMDFSADIRHYKNTNETVDGITSLIKELVAEAIGEDESLVEVHKRNLVVASQFNAVIKSRNSLRHKQRQALKNLLKALEEVI